MNLESLGYIARLEQVVEIVCRQVSRYLFRRFLGRPHQGPSLLREGFEQLSGSFVKFGQILALQIDSLPREYCDALLTLLDRIPPVSAESVAQVFVEEMGLPPLLLYREFDFKAVASASIGQVHRATLRDGTPVAVKVQRPGIRAIFERDLVLMGLCVRLVFFLRLQWLYFMRDPVRELSIWAEDELDYRREAGYCKLLGDNAAQTPTEHVPRVYWELTSVRVLTMDFLDGPSVAEFLRMTAEKDEAGLAALRESGFVPAQFSANVISNFLSDAFRFGVFHADLHPANLIILPDNVVGYVDFGIVATLTPEARRKQIELTMAYASGSAEAICRQFLNICSVGKGADLNGLRQQVSDMARRWYCEPAIGGKVRFRANMTSTMMDLLSVCQRYGVLVDREMIKYIRSTILADGLISRLAPGFDLARILGRVVEEYVMEESRKKIFSTSGQLSFLTDLTLWMDATPRDFIRVLSAFERHEFRMHTSVSMTPDSSASLRMRTAYVAVIWAISLLFLVSGGSFPSFRSPNALAVIAGLSFTVWSLWLMGLLIRLRLKREEV